MRWCLDADAAKLRRGGRSGRGRSWHNGKWLFWITTQIRRTSHVSLSMLSSGAKNLCSSPPFACARCPFFSLCVCVCVMAAIAKKKKNRKISSMCSRVRGPLPTQNTQLIHHHFELSFCHFSLTFWLCQGCGFNFNFIPHHSMMLTKPIQDSVSRSEFRIQSYTWITFFKANFSIKTWMSYYTFQKNYYSKTIIDFSLVSI